MLTGNVGMTRVGRERYPDLLATIVAATQRSVSERMEACQPRTLELTAAERCPRAEAFREALICADRYNVMAECKRRSPSRGILRSDYCPETIAKGYVAGGAVALSVLTEPAFFDGKLVHLTKVRAAVDVPLLQKDFFVSKYQLLEARAVGADAVLLIVAALTDHELRDLLFEARNQGLAALVEVHDVVELTRALEAGATIVGVNNRNLRTLEVDLATSRTLIAQIPDTVVTVVESGLKGVADLVSLREAGYDAFLIGESLMTRDDPGKALRELLAGAIATARSPRASGGTHSRVT